MRIIPWEYTFEIYTGLSKDTARERLKEKTGTVPNVTSAGALRFSGEVHISGFRIRESGRLVNCFLPVFHGLFDGDDHIVVRVRADNALGALTTVFSWSAALVMFYQTCFLLSEQGPEAARLWLFLLQGIAYLGIAILVPLFYWRKVDRGKEFLTRLFTG